MTPLRVHSIFCSIQGESTLVGLPTVFIRLAGCSLCCSYCDAVEAQKPGGQSMTPEQVLGRLSTVSTRLVTVTGGEPLDQEAALPLLTALCDAGYRVSLETSGSRPVERVDPRVKIVMDVKTPGSGMVDSLWDKNLEVLKPGRDEIKFVVSDRNDFEWIVLFLEERQLDPQLELIVSPVFGAVRPDELAGWVLACSQPLRLQLQLHKIIWPAGEPETMGES